MCPALWVFPVSVLSVKVLRDIFQYKPMLTKQQFLQWGFSQRKISVICDVINLVLQKHSQLKKVRNLAFVFIFMYLPQMERACSISVCGVFVDFVFEFVFVVFGHKWQTVLHESFLTLIFSKQTFNIRLVTRYNNVQRYRELLKVLFLSKKYC